MGRTAYDGRAVDVHTRSRRRRMTFEGPQEGGTKARRSLRRILALDILVVIGVGVVVKLIWHGVDVARLCSGLAFSMALNLGGEWLYRWRNDDPDV